MTPSWAELSWIDRLFRMRDRLLGDPRFHRWAGSLPLIRWIARRRVRSLFDLCAGFVYSQVLLACVRLRLFDILKEGPKTAAELSKILDLPPEATERLLLAAVSLKLLARRSRNRFGLGEFGAVMAGSPSIAAMVEHHTLLYADLADPVSLLRGERTRTSLGQYWPYAEGGDPAVLAPDKVTQYSAIMSASQSLIAAEVLDAYPLEKHQRLLDVGGGLGAFLIEAGRRSRELQMTLFDLPAVVDQAEPRIAAAGLSDRVDLVGGDFFSSPLPRGADVISLVRVIHDHDDAEARSILRAAYQALPPGGTLLVAEPMAGTRGAEPIGDAYFGLYLFAMGSGRPRRPGEIDEALASVGFREIRHVRTRTPLLTGLVVGRRPN